MKRLLYILLLIPMIGLSQTGDIYNPQIDGYVYMNKNGEKLNMLRHIINQNNVISMKNDKILANQDTIKTFLWQTIEADHQLAMKLPSKLMHLFVFNAYIGDSAGVKMDPLAKYNIIISDTCTGEGLQPNNNFVIDYMSNWINLNLVDWEITELRNAEAAGDYYRALNMVHRGVSRSLNLMPGYDE